MRRGERDDDPLEPRHGRRRVWGSVGLAVAALAVLYFAGWMVTGARFANELARLKAQGEPVTPSDLLPKLKPGERNAADVYEQAFALSPKRALDQLYANGPWRWNPADLPLAHSIADGNSQYYELLEEASRIPTCAMPVQWSEMGTAQFDDHARGFNWALRALDVKLQLQAHDGDLNGALATCAALLRIADHMEQVPDSSGRVTASYVQSAVLDGLEDVLSRGDPAPAACRTMADQLAGRDYHARLVRAVQARRVAGLTAMRWMEGGQWFVHYPPKSARWVVREAYPVVAKPLWNGDKERYLEMTAEFVEAARRPWPEVGTEVRRLDRQVARLFPRLASPVAWITPTGKEVFGFTGRDVAMAGAWQVALVLKAYHHDHGAYPATLAEVEKTGWPLPKDPFTGQPYRYRRNAKGFTVWSVGFDLKDDGARPFSRDTDDFLSPGHDFVVRCAR